MFSSNVIWIMVGIVNLAGLVCSLGIPQFHSFECRNNRTIAIEFFCDEIDDCGDGSDEKTHKEIKDSFATWQSCVNARNPSNYSCLVSRQLICDDDVTCQNLTPCDLKCDSHYTCLNTSRCVRRSTVCNGIACDGCEEDQGWRNGHGFKCRRNGVQCVLPQQLLHDDISDCDGGVDICFSNVSQDTRYDFMDDSLLLRDKCFRCLDDSMIISTSSVCDGIIDCPDLSDECLCNHRRKNLTKICKFVVGYPVKTVAIKKKHKNRRRGRKEDTTNCRVGQVACRDGSCIERSSVCDGVTDCDLDERFSFCGGTINCRDATKREKLCRCKIDETNCENLYGVACNGKAECPSPHHRHNFPEDECEAFCYDENWNFPCDSDLKMGFPLTSAVIPCRPAPASFKPADGKEYDQSYQVWQKCDGNQSCIMGDDEENCTDRLRCDVIHGDLISINVSQGYQKSGFDRISPDFDGFNKPDFRARRLSLQTCDGVEDCHGGVDESDELCNSTRFRCPALGGKKVSIDRNYLCDFHITCDDASDEMNCSAEDGRFYCESGQPLFVHKRKMFNGRGDCSDWSDECPTTSTDDVDVFSSRYALIGNPMLRALVWIMGLLSLFGNATVLYLESKKLRQNQHLTPIACANRLLILNLAASDIIMGVYLISLGVAGAHMQGSYCSQELHWRSSSSCVMLGVLSVLSSETSVITMIMLTSCRLFAVMKPFESASRPKKRAVALMIASTWSISLVLALIPLSPNLAATFVSHVQFNDQIFFGQPRIKINSARKLFQNLLTYDLKSNITLPKEINIDELSWSDLKSLSDQFFKHDHFQIKRVFGYYSINSVCIPKFFVTTSDSSWGFSFFVTLFNFCSFLFVASAYAMIYVQSRKRAEMRSSTRHNDKVVTDLQKKILRLIVTDFFCWIPLCIIAFAKLSGAYVSENAYVFAAIFLLPINSAINPLLYSDLPDFLYRSVKKRLGNETSSGEGEVSKQISSNNERRMTDSTYVLSDKRNKSNNSNKVTGKINVAYRES